MYKITEHLPETNRTEYILILHLKCNFTGYVLLNYRKQVIFSKNVVNWHFLIKLIFALNKLFNIKNLYKMLI